ncbi:MAG: DNA repair protein RadA [Armatimonadota bacterium]
MARSRVAFVCERCGAESPQWQGRCPACSEWNTLVEFAVAASPAARRTLAGTDPVPASELDLSAGTRLQTGIGELDRVLGGGFVLGSVVLLAGDPGIGKSTLVLQAANSFSLAHGPCLYVSGEESIAQVGARARRLGAAGDRLLLLAETDVEAISAHVRKARPALVVADSVQAMSAAELEAAPGSVSQVRECGARVLRLAKELAVPCVLVGHVTKEGTLAGPRLLEHMVDTVMSLEGDRHSGYRVLRCTKNRFGSTDELGLFHMTETGLEGVPDASAALLAERRNGTAGSAVVAAIEGTRPLLLEVQALVSQASPGGNPRRSVTGLDYGRACLILAVLEKRAAMPMASADVFLNIPGGLRLSEPAADLGIAMALASSFREAPVLDDTACVGEVGLGGEVRSVPQLSRRLGELGRRGFRRCLTPLQAEAAAPANIEAVPVETIVDAFRVGLSRRS